MCGPHKETYECESGKFYEIYMCIYVHLTYEKYILHIYRKLYRFVSQTKLYNGHDILV